MDLVTFIPGILNNALFSPGPSTPAPYNVNHTGLTDGTGPASASANVAQVYNRLLLQIAATIDFAALPGGVNNNNWAQLPAAVQKIAQDVVAGAVGTGYVTTATYNNDFQGSLAANGYFFLKGLLIQWGMFPAVGFPPQIFNITFPIAFPNQVFQVYGTSQNKAFLDPTINGVHESEHRLMSKSNSGAQWMHQLLGDGNIGYSSNLNTELYWFAIGR